MEVILNGKPVKLSSRQGKQFAADCAKVASHEITIDQLRRQYELSADALQTIIDDPAFVRVMAKQNKRQTAEASNVVNFPTPPPIDNTDLIVDLCRYSEGILDQQQVRRKYRALDDDIWEKLGQHDALVEKIEDERIRRIRNGQARREKSQLLAMKAPDVLSSILLNPSANPKHRTDAAVVLDRFATPPGEAAAADSSRFHIIIQMGDEQVSFNKSRTINVDDADDPANTTLAAIAASKKDNDDGGQGHF